MTALSVLTNENAELTNLLKSKNVDEYTLECIRLAQRARDFFDSASKKLTNQQDHGVLIEALARCRHQASYSIGDSDALSGQLSKIRDIVNETLNTRATK